MIDTDKYEGHNYNWYVKYHKNTGKHEVRVDGKNEVEDDHVCYLQYHPAFKDVQAKNAKLIADAPLLLAEVKRLRKQLLRGVEMMNMTPNQTKEARRNRAKRFEREVREMIE